MPQSVPTTGLCPHPVLGWSDPAATIASPLAQVVSPRLADDCRQQVLLHAETLGALLALEVALESARRGQRRRAVLRTCG